MATRNNRGADLSFLPPGMNNFYTGYDQALTAPLKKETTEAPTETPPERTGPIASETRINGNNVKQTGKNLGGSLTLGDATKYLKDSTKGYVQGFGANTFAATQLPVTTTSLYTGDPKQTPGFDMSVPDIGGANAVNFDRDGGVAAVQSRDLTDNQPITGKEQRIEGASDRPKGGRLADALNELE